MAQLPKSEELAMLELMIRFTKEASSGCWEWLGGLRNGYGLVKDARRTTYSVHRLSAAMFLGPANGQLVLHSCDNPKCWRPAHLRYGTQLENVRQAVQSGRMKNTVTRKRALTALQIAEVSSLLSCGLTKSALSRKFGVSRSVIIRVSQGFYAV